MPTQSSGSYELAIIPFAPVPVSVRGRIGLLLRTARRSYRVMTLINSTKRDNLFCSCLIVQLVLLKKIVDAR